MTDLVEEARAFIKADFTSRSGSGGTHSKRASLVERLCEELQDIHDGERIILEEKCASDEIHCGCVPTLRKEIVRLTQAQEVAS